MPSPAAAAHPRGLYTLFFTEMWERFSYYGMRALLVLYLVNALEYPRDRALALYATYTGLVYLTPIVGGYLADRWLGSRRAVLIGGLVMALGHFAMAFPALLHLALGLLVAGNGFFKPNISTMVGSLYQPHDRRRDGGFTIFYMGINLGAFLSPLVCGTLGEKIGWHYGFAAAGVGMLFGLGVFLAGQRRLGSAGLPPGTAAPGLRRRDWVTVLGVSAGTTALVAMVVVVGPVLRDGLWSALGDGGRLAVAGTLLVVALALPRLGRLRAPAATAVAAPLTAVERQRLLVVGIMAFFVIFFWMGFEQAGGTMNLFADQKTDRYLLGWEMPASYFQSVNPLAILVLAPLFSALWVRLDGSRYALSSVAKQGLGMVILGLGFVVLAIADQRAGVAGKVGMGWLLAVYILHTAGELCLSPIGLSMVTKLAPARLVALVMGLWFSAMALANYLAGTLESIVHGYGIPLYWFLVASSVGAGILLLLLEPWIRRLMHGVD